MPRITLAPLAAAAKLIFAFTARVRFEGAHATSGSLQRCCWRTGKTAAVVLACLALGIGTGYAKGKPPPVPPPTPPDVVNPPVPPPPPVTIPTVAADTHGFSVIGFLQSATVATTGCASLSQQGGTAVVNGLTITIPCNTIVQMPAASYTWADLLNPTTFPKPLTVPAAVGSPASPAYPSTEFTIIGNIVAGQYIAGLIYISQQSLNSGQGYITRIDYPTGAIFVGGRAGGPDLVRLLINDPNGRFGRPQSPDARFSVDDENPTIKAETGYPMCVPRRNPTTTDDALCPQKNRPKVGVGMGCRNFGQAGVISPKGFELFPPVAGTTYCSSFVMKAPPGTASTPSLPPSSIASDTEPDARQQAPFEVGDHITYAGTLLLGDGQGPNGSDTISVHTISANVGIFTQPDTLPVYIAIGEFGVSADASDTAPSGAPQEAQNRIFLEAMVTDVKSIVDIYLVDYDPVSGQETQRWITPSTMTGEAGAPGSNGHVIDGGITTQFTDATPGRARLRANKATPGILTSPTRSVRVVTRSLCDPANINTAMPVVSDPKVKVRCLERVPAANGLSSGQYLAPTFEFIFPENVVVGDPIVPNNLWTLGFLVNGEGPGTGPLSPTPW